MARPFPSQRAITPPPAVELTLTETAAVRRIRRGEAIPIGRELPIGAACRLALFGHITIQPGAPQLAVKPRRPS